MEGQIVFRNPDIKIRSEDFGGVVKIDSSVFLLDASQFHTLKDFTGHGHYKEVMGQFGEEFFVELIEEKVLITINDEDARSILKEKGGE